MEESRRSIIILLIAAGMLALILAMLQAWPKAQGNDESLNNINIFDYKTTEIQSVTLIRNSAKRIMIQKNKEWMLEDGTKLDYNDADLLVTFISYLYSDNLVEEHTRNKGLYGLEDPPALVSFTLMDGSGHLIEFGNMTADQKSIYMLIDGQDTVYTMPVDIFNIIFEDVI